MYLYTILIYVYIVSIIQIFVNMFGRHYWHIVLFNPTNPLFESLQTFLLPCFLLCVFVRLFGKEPLRYFMYTVSTVAAFGVVASYVTW